MSVKQDAQPSFAELAPWFGTWMSILSVKAKPPPKLAIFRKIGLRLILSMHRGGLAFERKLGSDPKKAKNMCEKDLLLYHIVGKYPPCIIQQTLSGMPR